MNAELPGRALGRFETALTLTGEHAPFVIVVAVRLEGAPGAETLRGALDALQREQPLLRTRIAATDGGYRFEVDPAPPPVRLTALPRRDDEHWRQAAEEELNRGLDGGSAPLMRASYLHDRDGGEDASGNADLVLTLHHAIVDAAACERLVDRLLALATGTAGDPPTASGLPPAADVLLPPGHRGSRGAARRLAFLARQLADEAAWAWRRRGAPAPEIPAAGRCHVLPRRLDAAATAALVRRARRRRVTLNAALDAALLLATVRHLPGGAAGLHRYVTFADLRPYLKPPPDPDRLGCYISMLRYSLTGLTPATAFWPLAQRITRQVGAGAHRGDKYAAAHFAPMVMRRTLGRGDQRMSTTALSYSGVARLRRLHGGTVVRDLHAFISNFPLGPELSAAARLLGDELRLDVLYLDCDTDAAGARRIADGVLALLRGDDGEETS